jgi:hypothetical protein
MPSINQLMKKRSLAFFSISVLFCSLYFLSCRKDNIEGISSEKDWIAVDQGALWTDDIRNAYYTEDQGVRNIPYSWLTSLKDASGSRFLYDKLQRYGFLPMSGRQMPVGFALGRDTANILSAGLTCAGCHTRQINVGDESYRIDGGPALINFEKYTKDLQAALTYTVNNSIELEQFLDRVIIASIANGDPAINDRNALRNKVIRFQQNLSLFNQLSLPADNMWGLGRLDALNQILNRVSGIDISPYPDSMIVSNISPANNPVRFPFIWNMQYQDYTQWAGTGVNGNSTQALLRNGGECLGVGAQFRPVPNASMPDGFDFLAVNSVNFDGLNALEQYINKMGPPRWPWFVNSSLVAQGEGLYIDNCVSCHGITPGEPRPPTASTWATPLVDVGTDNWYYETLSRMGSPGVLSSILPADVSLIAISGLCNQKMLKQYDPSISFISTTHTTIVVGKYESRVLQGIWAAAPYLHNGSVPTLEDLLKPASERPSSFYVGVNFDTTKVGLSEDQPVSNGYQFSTFGLGNSNAGHEYGTQLNPQERAALIEYMKTL